MAVSKNQENPFMSELPLRDYIAIKMIISALEKDDQVNSIELATITHRAHLTANDVIANRYDYMILELDQKIREAEMQAEYNRITAANEEIMAGFTPEKVQQLQANYSEQQEKHKRGWFK